MNISQHYQLLLGLGEEWRVSRVALDIPGRKIDIYLEYNERSSPCPVCGALVGLHDRQDERTWRHLDTMQFETLIHARTPRCKCPEHGVKVIDLPWTAKRSHFTLLFEAFAIEVIRAARSIKDAQRLLRLSWFQTRAIMSAAVRRGVARRDGGEISFIGLDEKSFLHGMRPESFACVMTDLDNGRVLDVSRGRNEEGAKALIDKALTLVQQWMVCGVAMDMSAPFGKAVRDCLVNADVVYDKFHIKQHLNDGVDQVRRRENAILLRRNDRSLVKSRHLWLKGFEHLSDESRQRLKGCLAGAMKTGAAWGLKEGFEYFWKSRDRNYAAAFFEFWYGKVMDSGLGPMIKIAKMFKRHLSGLLAWFDSRINNAMTEGYNGKIQSLITTSRGFRNFENFRTVTLFYCGKLDMAPDIPYPLENGCFH